MHYNPRVVEAQPRVVLKLGRKRTTSVASDSSLGSSVVIKRFHDAGFLGRNLDRFRSRAEFRTLRTFHRKGLPVPEPIAVRAHGGAFEIVTRFVVGAIRLADLVDGRADWPCATGRVAQALGAALARAHELGLDHPDLHAGNVLVDASCKVWLVDVRGAQLRQRLADKSLVRDLVVLAADLRERTSPRFRAQVLVAWLRALAPARRARICARTAAFADDVELRARKRRREVVMRSRLRWTRASSVCAPIENGWRSQQFSAEGGRAAESNPPRQVVTGPQGRIRTGPQERIVTGEVDSVRRAWWTCARLAEHRVDAARPIAIEVAPLARAVFDGNSSPIRAVAARLSGARTSGRERRRIAASLGALAGALFDRGLLARGGVEVDDMGRARLGPSTVLSYSDLHDPTAGIAALADFRTHSTRRERAIFCAHFVLAQRSSPRFVANVRARLVRG